MRRLAPLSFLILGANASRVPTSASTTKAVADATVETGRVFQTGGIDGLVLYALVLSTFLMFLITLGTVWFAFRALDKKTRLNNDAFAKKDALNADQTKGFIESMDRTASSLSALAVAVSGDLQERAATAVTLARMEGTDAELKALLSRLDRQ